MFDRSFTMPEINEYYSTYEDENNRHAYDIKALGTEIFRTLDIGFINANGSISGCEPLYSPTTKEDYDGDFITAMLSISPVYKVKDFLEHHYIYYSNGKSLNSKEQFINHIQFEILPHVKSLRLEIADVLSEWILKKKTMILQKQLQEKNEFLKKAYEAICEYSPSSPLSTYIEDPREFGKSIGFDVDTTERIVMELVSDGYASSAIGMNMFMVTSDGLNYLRQVERENSKIEIVPLHFSVGNNSNVQFQNGTVNSNQTLHVNEINKEELLQFINGIKTNLTEIEKHLDKNDVTALQTDVEYIEKNIERSNTLTETTKVMLKGIGGLIKKLPDKIISSLVTIYMKQLLGMP